MQSLRGMGTVRTGRGKRDLSKHETVYVDPEYDKLRAAAAPPGEDRDQRTTRTVLASGSTLETLGGLVGLVTAIAGFTARPIAMAGTAVIAIGVALFAQGLSVMSRWRDAARRFELARRGERRSVPDLAGSVSTEVFAGLVGLVLGVIALAGSRPLVVLPAAVLVYGGGLLLGGATQPDLVFLAPERNPRYARVTYDAIQTSGGVMLLVGVGAVVLGILALLHVAPIVTLTLVALVAISVALLFTGGVLTARLARRLSHP
jgi:hypothetical protein